MVKHVKTLWLDIILVLGYILADTLHYIGDKYFYEIPLNESYTISQALYFPSNYLFGPSVFAFLLLFLYAKDVESKTLRLGVLICSVRDFIAEILEAININVVFFDNFDFVESSIPKMLYLIFITTVCLYFRNLWKFQTFYSSRHLFLLLLSLLTFLSYIYIN